VFVDSGLRLTRGGRAAHRKTAGPDCGTPESRAGQVNGEGLLAPPNETSRDPSVVPHSRCLVPGAALRQTNKNKKLCLQKKFQGGNSKTGRGAGWPGRCGGPEGFGNLPGFFFA